MPAQESNTDTFTLSTTDSSSTSTTQTGLTTTVSGITFVLENIDESTTLTVSAEFTGEVSTSLTADAVIEIDISQATIRNVFKFQSDSDDITDVAATDISFIYGAVLNLQSDLCNGLVGNAISSGHEDGNTSSNQEIEYDFTRKIAVNLFNTHRGVDLISNETDVRAEINSKLVTMAGTICTKIDAGETDGTFYNSTDASNCYGRFLMDKIAADAPARLETIADYEVDSSGNYYMPINTGDAIAMKITLNQATGQSDLTSSSRTDDKSYLVVLRIVADQ